MNSFSFSNHQTPRWHWPLMALVAGARFLNLGFIDLQAWDEALYATRAKGILLFGGWFDQTAFAIDGLYSALHPPLQVWLTTIAFYCFGPDETSARLVSAVAGAATLPVIYLLGRRWVHPQVGMFSVLFYGLNPFVLFYTRQGQFDTLLVLLLTLSVYFILRSHESDGNRLWPVMAGLSIGCALMTKLFIPLGIPLAYVLWVGLTGKHRDHQIRLNVLTLLLVALIVALPWYVFMTFKHGGWDILFFLKQSALWERSVSGIEGNVKPLEIFYYGNQLIVLFPFAAVWFLSFAWETRLRNDTQAGFVLMWFLLFFVTFSLLRTKLAVYMLPMLVPVSLLAGNALWQAAEKKMSLNRSALLLAMTLIFVLWSSNQHWRNSVKDLAGTLLRSQLPSRGTLANVVMLILLAIVLVGIVFLFWRSGRLARWTAAIPTFLFLPLGILAAYHIVVGDRFQYVDGATALKHFVEEHDVHRIVVAGYERNPQLSWYLDGADLGWRDDLSVRRIIPPADSMDYRRWLMEEMEGEPLSTLLVIEKDKFIRYKVVDPSRFAAPEFSPVFESRRYTGYVRSRTDFLALFSPQTEPFVLWNR